LKGFLLSRVQGATDLDENGLIIQTVKNVLPAMVLVVSLSLANGK